MTTLSFIRKEIFLIDENINIQEITNNKNEYRSFYTLFHALYTYYTTTLCLDNCLNSNCFSEKQKHEAIGRMGFYLIKYKLDLDNYFQIINFYNGIENVLTNKGIGIFNLINEKYFEIYKKYNNLTKGFSYENQPYNFTYKNFTELNSL